MNEYCKGTMFDFFMQAKVCVVLEFQNSGGVIINITATLSVRGAALQTHAGTAKAAIGNILYIY